MCRGKRKHDVTTVVTYSHASTPHGQSERAYYLSYFINNSDIVLNIVIPPLVTSCKILIIIVNFLAALAARKRCDSRLLLHLSNSIFWGTPLSQVSVVLPSANNVVNAFFCFVLSPIVAVAKTQPFRPTLSKPGCESNILVIFCNFRHTLTTSINLHATSTFFMLDNELQRTIHTLASIIINIVQYLRSTDGDPNRIQRTKLPSKQL